MIFFLMVAAAMNAPAQDVIVKKDGSTILSKVTKVGTSEIEYKKWSNQDGPAYSIAVSDVMTINYQNGEKDTFNQSAAPAPVPSSTAQESAQRYIKKPADARNAEILSLYNKEVTPNEKSVKDKNTYGKIVILGIAPTSIMSNEDIEMTFVKEIFVSPEEGSPKYQRYNINLKNKTDKVIYIDKGNCFRIYENGETECYFDATKQLTVNDGRGGGASLGLGSVAGTLGIGGAVGKIAGGIGVGGNSNHSVSTTYTQQRVIAIPPGGNKNLCNEEWIQTNKGHIFGYREYEKIDRCEWLSAIYDVSSLEHCYKMKKGQVEYLNEDESPWKREYFITYSTSEDFNTYSTLNAKLFVHEVIGGMDKLIARELSKETIIVGTTNVWW